MKKIVLVFMIIVLAGSLMACGNTSDGAKKQTSVKQTTKNTKNSKKSDTTKKSKSNNVPENTTEETKIEETQDYEYEYPNNTSVENKYSYPNDTSEEKEYSNNQDNSLPVPEEIPEPAGWIDGIAGAYGGSTDPGCGDTTATGELLDDFSMGVAIPMSWPNYNTYFGRMVEIKYGETIVLARVNDCGYMGGGSMSLDLQPGVFKAFGFESCNEWGVRPISYRFR